VDIIIDGYNVIGSRGGLWGDVAARREAFVAELSRYARARGHAVTVVFDGADAGLPTDRCRPRASACSFEGGAGR
jgi:predicted RNA-binding protein with PIN domain